MRNDLAIVKLLETLHGRFDDLDDSSPDNTVIQFFEAPHDNVSLTASVSVTTSNPSTLVWGDGGATDAGWFWGYGGVYS